MLNAMVKNQTGREGYRESRAGVRARSSTFFKIWWLFSPMFSLKIFLHLKPKYICFSKHHIILRDIFRTNFYKGGQMDNFKNYNFND